MSNQESKTADQESVTADIVKQEVNSESFRIKREIENAHNNEAIRVKNEVIENARVKQEVLEAARVKQEVLEAARVKQEQIPNLTREDTQPISDLETESNIISHGLPKQISKSRPKRPKRNALSLEKIASVDTENLFVFTNENGLKSPLQLTLTPSLIPIIETEDDRFPSTFPTPVKRKRRQNIDNLLDKYDNGTLRILNDDGSVEVNESSSEKRVETLPETEDAELDILLSRPKRLRNSRNTVCMEKSEIDEITEKYDFINQSTKLTNESLTDIDDVLLNRSLSKEFTVRIMCGRCVHSFQTRNDTVFEEIVERLAKKLEVDPKQIMLTLRDETVGLLETPSSINLEESSIVDAIVLSTTFVSPEEENEPKIKIKIQFSKQFGGQVPIIAPLNTELRGILDQICESKNITETFQLQFDGDTLDLSSTLQFYDIEDDDVIDAIMVT